MSSDKHCCVPGCKESENIDKVLHQFPNPENDRDRLDSWLFAIGRGVSFLNENTLKYRRVCCSHFEPKYLCRNNRISNIAIPTLRLPGSLSLPRPKRTPMRLCDISDPSTSTDRKMVYLRQESFGDKAKKFIWETDGGFSVSAISYGAIITSIKVPDKDGQLADVVLGFDDLESYVKRNTPYLGAAVGRCANRIARAEFTIEDVTYQLAKNIGENHLHGGIVGFDKVFWQSSVEGTKVTFSYLSKDSEEGYPGDLLTNITYDVTDDGTLHMDFVATTTKPTVVNLTNHSYFNLAGHNGGEDELSNHVVAINADRITETNDSIPTGNFVKVGGTPYDLRTARRLGDVIDYNYDDNFCVTTNGHQGLNFVSRVTHPSSGRFLELYSNQPGVQFYISNALPSPDQPALIGKGGVGYRRHGAFCLETQTYPDAVNHPQFPSSVLKPGHVYMHTVKYTFGAEYRDQPTVVSH